MNKSLQNDISFSLKIQMVQAKINFYLTLPVYHLSSTKNIKDENTINNKQLLHVTNSHKHYKMMMSNI